MIKNQRHLAISVKSLEKGIEFYSALGGDITSQDLEQGVFIEELLNQAGVIIKTCKIKFRDGSRIELMEFVSEQQTMTQRNSTSSISQIGYHHVAFTVSDLELAVAMVIQFGGKTLGKTLVVGSSHSVHAVKAKHVYMLDPFGNLLHLAEDSN